MNMPHVMSPGGLAKLEELSNMAATVANSAFASLGGAGVAVGGVYPAGAAHADFDGDGDIDVALVVAGQVVLMRNDGRGGFSAVSGAFADGEGVVTQLAWADFNGDGAIDLAVSRANTSASIPPANQLFRNRNDGTFADVSSLISGGRARNSRAVAWGDFDADGDLDLAIGNEDDDQIFRNDGATFTELCASPCDLDPHMPSLAHLLARARSSRAGLPSAARRVA